MLGAFIGDVVGSRFEFHNHRNKNFELVNDSCFFTDDTVLTVAVMDILLSGDASSENCKNTIAKWAKKYPNSGYGLRFNNWIYSVDHTPYKSIGNGSAMRISPVGWFAKSEEDVKKISCAITDVTHNTYQGRKGAEVVAMCIFKALHGATKDDLRKYIVSKYPEVETFDYETLRKTYGFNETCPGSVPQALYCFLISNSFEDCLRTTISIGGDCDTTAAISCAIAEAFYLNVPEDLCNAVFNKLSEEMKHVIREFNFMVRIQKDNESLIIKLER